MSISEKTAKIIAISISAIFHPLFIPLYTILIYFHLTPRYFMPQHVRFLDLYMLIVSIVIPLVFFGIMFYSKAFKLTDISVRERFFLSVIMAVVYFIIFNKITDYHQYLELYPFFFGILLGLAILSLYNYFGQKPSIHAMSMGGVLGFLMIWSYYSHLNILPYLSLLILVTAVVIASRLYLDAHNFKEILKGLFIGILTQVAGFYFVLAFF